MIATICEWALIKAGMHPAQIAESVFQAIVEEKFYIFAHPQLNGLVQARMDDILQERNPALLSMDGP